MSIARHDGKNVGSIEKLWIKLKSEITDTHTPQSGDSAGLTISQNINLLIGPWTPIELIPGEASWQEVQTEDDHGAVFTYTIQLVIQKDRKEVTEVLAGFADRKVMAIVQERNDNSKRRLVGEAGLYDYHCKVTFIQVKERKPGRNAYDLTITGKMHHAAPYYEGAIPE